MFGLLLALIGSSDEDLVRRFREGDKAAFSELVLRYQDRVYGLCRRLLGDPIIAEDVAQDVFLALYRSLPDFRGEASLSTFIFRATVNHCKNRRTWQHRRRWDRHEPLEGTGDDDAPPRELADENSGTDRALHRSEAGEILHRALERLDESERSIILLRDLEDLSYEEIAAILDTPRGTVKSRLHRARAELAKVLGRFIGPRDVLE